MNKLSISCLRSKHSMGCDWGSASLKMSIRAHFFLGQFWPLK